MSDHAQNLRQAADEIRREGHAGWGNACEWAADEIERLRQWETCGREWLGKTDWVQERVNAGSWPISALGKHRADVMREEIERLTAALQYEQHRADRQGTHGDGCADWGPAHYECAIRERDDLRQQLAEAELDARRYRWLRDNGSDSRVCQKDGYGGYELRWNSALDAAIDAAMGGSDA